MRNSAHLIKKRLAVFLVVLMSINTLGAVVSDNDGSAFITKAEFDSLKNDFQSQIDQYNTSIDAKIDGAIASYLAGVNVSSRIKLMNQYENYKLGTGQYLRGIKWIATGSVINPPVSSIKDTQELYQRIKWYAGGSGKVDWGILSVGYKSESETAEKRIEINQHDEIIAWGKFSCYIEGDIIYLISQRPGTGTNYYGYAPYPVQTIAKIMRKPQKLVWNDTLHAGNVYDITTGGTTSERYPMNPELNWFKYYETIPQESASFNLDDIKIAPLLTEIEACLPPAPGQNDPDFTFSEDPGNTCYAGSRLVVNEHLTDGLISVTNDVWVPSESYVGQTTLPSIANAACVWLNMHINSFSLLRYNELSFKVINDYIGVNVPFKSGLPVTQIIDFKSEDQLLINIESPATSGILILYVKDNPDENWNGNKTNYTSDPRWKVTKNHKYSVTLDIEQNLSGCLYAVWLPDEPAVLPTLDIYKIG